MTTRYGCAECDDAASESGARWDSLVWGVGGGDGLSSVLVWDRDGHCAISFFVVVVKAQPN